MKVEGELHRSDNTLNIDNVGYVVNVRHGPWWKGACFRKVRKKTVLSNISMQVKAGKITAILGNSGKSIELDNDIVQSWGFKQDFVIYLKNFRSVDNECCLEIKEWEKNIRRLVLND